MRQFFGSQGDTEISHRESQPTASFLPRSLHWAFDLIHNLTINKNKNKQTKKSANAEEECEKWLLDLFKKTNQKTIHKPVPPQLEDRYNLGVYGCRLMISTL